MQLNSERGGATLRIAVDFRHGHLEVSFVAASIQQGRRETKMLFQGAIWSCWLDGRLTDFNNFGRGASPRILVSHFEDEFKERDYVLQGDEARCSCVVLRQSPELLSVRLEWHEPSQKPLSERRDAETGLTFYERSGQWCGFDVPFKALDDLYPFRRLELQNDDLK